MRHNNNKITVRMMRQSHFLKAMIFLIAILFLTSCGTSAQAVKPVASSVVHKMTPTLVPTPTQAPTPTPQPTPTIGQPTRLLIPTIGLNAGVEHVGIVANGDLATPTQNPWDGVGWYSNGPRPGEDGSAVIDGHLDRPGGYPAVFWNLRYLHPGDRVIVQDAQGKQYHFHVTHLAWYPPQQAPLQEIFGVADGSYLNLITCAGTWIPSEHQTTLRLVVYTTLDV